SSSIIGDRVYIGGEDHFYYCFDLNDGHIIFKTQLGGSVEGGTAVVDNRIYVDTEAGDLLCLNADDGSIIWKARIGADSNSTPAVVNGFVYTAAEDGVVRCYTQETGELVRNLRLATTSTRRPPCSMAEFTSALSMESFIAWAKTRAAINLRHSAKRLRPVLLLAIHDMKAHRL